MGTTEQKVDEEPTQAYRKWEKVLSSMEVLVENHERKQAWEQYLRR